MNKNSLLVAIFVFVLSLGANAQGIEFFHGSFDEAKSLAAKENKPLFVDVYTSWCGPCKKLSKTVFTKKSVGDYFNEEFICFKLQADKKGTDNQKIAEQYKVTAYPTLMWLDGEGKLLHVSVGFKEAPRLIEEAKIVFDKDKRIGSIIEKWNNGDRTLPVVKKYFSFDRNATGEFDAYFSSLSEKQRLDRDLFEILSNIRLDLDGEVFEFLVKHRADYLKLVDPWDVNRVIDNKIEDQIVGCFKTPEFNPLLEKYRKLNIEIDVYAKKAEWNHHLKNKEFEQFEKSAKEYIHTFKSQRPYVYSELIKSLFDEDLMRYKNRKVAIEWALLALKDSKVKINDEVTLVQAYVVAGEKEKAIQLGEKLLKELEADKSGIASFYKEYIGAILKNIE